MTNHPSLDLEAAPKDKPNTELASTSAEVPAASSSLKRKRPPMIEIPNVLQEIQAGRLEFKDFIPRNDAVSFNAAGVALLSVKGKKKFMEDTHKIVSTSRGDSNKAFYGVYDGHGGRMAAEYVAENLHANIFDKVKDCVGNEEKKEAVRAGYLKTDEDFLNNNLVSGTCCVTALIEDQNLIVSNVGDCRAVLCKGGMAEALTADHKAEKEYERKRIEDKGGFVEMHCGAWRVHGILSVSRSIGDAHLKKWVVAEPETRILRLTRDMEFLVLASDGLWEEVGNQEAVDTITRLIGGKKLAASKNLVIDNDENCGCVNVSPSSRIRRVSLVKQLKVTNMSVGCPQAFDSWKCNEDDFTCENVSPPSKLRRISLTQRINPKPELPSEENICLKNGPASARLMAACKELVNLAVSKGSLDDITVMIIDLQHLSFIS